MLEMKRKVEPGPAARVGAGLRNSVPSYARLHKNVRKVGFRKCNQAQEVFGNPPPRAKREA